MIRILLLNIFFCLGGGLLLLLYSCNLNLTQNRHNYKKRANYYIKNPKRNNISINKNKTSFNKASNSVSQNSESNTKKTLKINAIAENTLDTLAPKPKSELGTDTSSKNDSLEKDSPKASSSKDDELSGPVEFHAKDSAVVRILNRKTYLYRDANVKYKDMDVKGEHLEMDQNKHQVTLFPATDSTGHTSFKDKTVMKQNENTYLSDTTVYNYITQKSIVQNTYTTQGELTVFGETIKKVSEDEVYIHKARFSTCNLNHPHFGFVTPKAKFRSQKYGATSLTFLQIEDIKIPIPIPFALFPLSKGVRNGILPPSFDQNSSWGYGLRDAGYYLKFYDYVDATIRSSLYSLGTWTINLKSRYLLRYRFNGNLSFDYQNINTTLYGDLRSNRSQSFNIRFQHNVDRKASPNSNFNINVNFGSTQFNQQQIHNAVANFNNSVNSSISYSRQFKALPSNLSITANHSQNSNTRQYFVTLPNISYAVSNFQPLQIFSSGIPHWYEKLTIQYSMNYSSRVNFADTGINLAKIIQASRWGVQHVPSISLPLPQLGPLIVTPSITYRENWTDQKITYAFNPNTKNLSPKIEKGLFRIYDMSMGVGLSTNIFGTFLFRSSSAIKGIRHVIRPQISIDYRPDINRHNYYTIEQNGVSQRRGFFENAIFGNFSEGQSANLNFNISSSVEIKVQNKKDTTAKNSTKKISIIDNFNVSGGYNLIRSSQNLRRLSNINFSMATNLLQKVQINASASLDPYSYSSNDGSFVPKLAWQNKERNFSLGRFTNFSLTLSSSIHYDASKKNNKSNKHGGRTLSIATQKYHDSLSRIYGYYVYVDSSAPPISEPSRFSFSINIGYNISYGEMFLADRGAFALNLTNQNITLSGNINLTDNWRFNFNTSMNIARNFILLALNQINIPYLTLSLSRQIHCWIINLNIVPIGLTQSLSIVLQPKASILQDLKIQRNRSFFNNLR